MTSPDISLIDLGLKFLNLGVTLVVGVYVWISNRNRVTNERITLLEAKTSSDLAKVRDTATLGIQEMRSDVDDRLDLNAQQLARLEEAGRHAMTRSDLGRIHQRIDEVSAEMREMKGKFAGASNTLDLIHKHLLQGKS